MSEIKIEGDVYDKLVKYLCNCAKTYSRLILGIEDSETYNPKMVLENKERANHRLKSDIEYTLLETDFGMSKCIKQQKGIMSEEKKCIDCKHQDALGSCGKISEFALDNTFVMVPNDFGCNFWCEKDKTVQEYIRAHPSGHGRSQNAMSKEKICKNCKYRDEYDKCNTLTRDNRWHKVPDDFNCRFWCENESRNK